MTGSSQISKELESILASVRPRADKAASVARLIQSLGPYRWVGLYDVGPELVSVIAHTGDPPAHPTFSITQGLTSAAIRQRRTIRVNDVRNDPRYLTAFGSTLSEMIIPIIDAGGLRVLGTLDIESDRLNAFSREDQTLLERCARAATPLWQLKASDD